MTKPYIAIVDDDAAFAAYLRTFLSLRGYDARCYSRGDELLAAMKQSELPDAVLLDVMMPGLDGMATLARPQGLPSGGAGDHAVRPQPGVDHRRGRAGWRDRLRRQAR